MSRCDTGNELSENHRLAQTGTTEQPGLTTTYERRQKINHLDTGLKKFGLSRKTFERRGITMDRPALFHYHVTAAINRFAEHVKHPAQCGFANRYRHGFARIDAFATTDQAIGTAQSYAADTTATQLLLDFTREVDRDTLLLGDHLHCIINCGQFIFVKFDIEGRTDNLCDVANSVSNGCHFFGSPGDPGARESQLLQNLKSGII